MTAAVTVACHACGQCGDGMALPETVRGLSDTAAFGYPKQPSGVKKGKRRAVTLVVI